MYIISFFFFVSTGDGGASGDGDGGGNSEKKSGYETNLFLYNVSAIFRNSEEEEDVTFKNITFFWVFNK